VKQRQIGRVRDGNYEVLAPDGGLIWQRPLAEARGDTKLAAAIKRNGWEVIPEA
jgi:hypothetical protein